MPINSESEYDSHDCVHGLVKKRDQLAHESDMLDRHILDTKTDVELSQEEYQRVKVKREAEIKTLVDELMMLEKENERIRRK